MVGTSVLPGGGGVCGEVLLGAFVIAEVIEGKSQRGFLQQGFAKSVINVQYCGRLTYCGQLKIFLTSCKFYIQ